MNDSSKEKSNIRRLLLEIKNKRDQEFKEDPDFLNLDWNDLNIVELNFLTFLSILHFNCYFPNKVITDKIKTSVILEKSSKWITPAKLLAKEFTVLEKKYPNVNYFEFFDIINNYIYINLYINIL